jgi:hypothetical protein
MIFNMLVQKQNIPNIQVLKLDSGEEIIANIVQHDADNYWVNNPFVLIAGQSGLQFSPYLLMADPNAKVKIFRSHVLAECDPSKGILDGYEKATSTLVLPQKQGIIV